MTYSLPFGLKQKPVSHYVEHGIIKFNVRDGVMHYTFKQITKQNNGVLVHGIVNDKTHLDNLLKTKTISDVIQTIEVVQQ